MADLIQAQPKALAQPINLRKYCFLCYFNVSNSHYCKVWSRRKGSEFQMKRRIEVLIGEELPLSAFPTNFVCKNCTNNIEKLEELEEFKKKLKEKVLAALGPKLNKKRKRKDVDDNPNQSTQLREDIAKLKVESQSDPGYDTKIESSDRKEQYLDSVESQDLEENLGLQFKMEMEVSEHELIPEYEDNEKIINSNEEITIDDSDSPVIREVGDYETNEKMQDNDVTESGVKNSEEEDVKLIDETKKGKLPPMLLIKGPNQSQFVLMPSSSSNLVCPPASVEGQSHLQSSQKSAAKNSSDTSKLTPKSLTSLPVKINPMTSLIPVELPGGQKCLIAPTNVCLAPMTSASLPKPKYSSATSSSSVSVKDSANFPSVHTHFTQPSKFKSILPKKTQSIPTTVQTKPVKTIVQIGNLGQMTQQQSKRKQLLNGSSKPSDVKNSKGFIGQQISSQSKPPMVMMGQKSILIAPSNVKGIAQDSVVMTVSSTMPSQIATTATTTTTTASFANNSVVLKVPIILDKFPKPKMKHNDHTQVSKPSPVALMTKPSSSVIVTSSTIPSATSTTNSLTTPLVIKGGSLMLSTSENGNFPVVVGKGNTKQTLSGLVSAKKEITSSNSIASVANPASSYASTENGMNTSINESNSNIVVTIQKNLETNEHQKLFKMVSRMNYLECKLAKAKQEIKSLKLSSAKKLPDCQLQSLKLRREKGKKVASATQSFLVASRVNAPGQAQQPSLLIPLVNSSGLNHTSPSQIADVMVNHGSGRSSPPLITSDLMSTVEPKEAEWGDETKALRDDNLFIEEPLCRELKTEPIDCVPEIEFEEEEITDPVDIT